MLVPKLVTTLKDYTRQQALSDVVAGVVVGALPLRIQVGPRTDHRSDFATTIVRREQ